MIDVSRERLLAMTAAAAWLTERTGRPYSARTVRRWAAVGVSGVRLERVRMGGRDFTSIEALQRFCAATTPAAVESPATASELGKALEADVGWLRANGVQC